MSLIEEPDPSQEIELASLLQKLCELEESGEDKSVIEQQLDGLSESQLAELFGAGQCLNLLHQLKGGESKSVSRLPMETTRLHDTTPEKLEPPSPSIPNQIGRYEIIRLAATGGFANVYEARDSKLDRRVALKVPLAERLGDRNAVERFHREARAVAMLSHPGVVPVYEAGEADGHHFIAFKWIEGRSLHGFLQTRQESISASEAAAAVERIADAVAHAHSKGILHRDIKPANMLIELEGDEELANWYESIRITDFGLAKHFSDSNRSEFKTVDGTILGTPAYMSPEQVRSEEEIGPASDVYSLGTVLYELLVGKTPHRKTSYSGTIRAIETETPEKIGASRDDVPADLISICEKCLCKESNDRYASAFELADDLRRLREGFPVKAKPQSRIYTLTRWLKRNPVVATCLALAFTGLSVGLAATVWSNGQIAAARDNFQRQVKVLESIFSDLDYNRDGDVLSETDLRDRLKSRLIESIDLIADTDDPVSSSRLMGTLGRTIATLGHPDESRSVVERAIKIGGDRLGSAEKQTLQVRLAGAIIAQGKYDESLALLTGLIDPILENASLEARTKSEALIYLAESKFQVAKTGKVKTAEAKAAFVRLENWLPESKMSDRRLHRHRTYAGFRAACCDYSESPDDDSFAALKKSFDLFIEVYGPQHNVSISAAYELTAKMCQRGEFDDALQLSESTLKHAKKKFGIEEMPTLLAYDSVLITCGMNSAVPSFKKRMIELLPSMQECCELVLKNFGESHPDMIVIYGNIASAWGIAGELEKAVEIKEQLLSIAEKEHGRQHVLTQSQILGLALANAELKKTDVAIELLEELIAASADGVPISKEKVKLARDQLRELKKVTAEDK